MHCRHCAWFRRPRGRVPTTCRDLGEEPSSEACSQFEIDAPTPDPPSPEAAIGALMSQNYRDIFHEILAESFTLEQDLHISVDTVRAQLQAQGANISAMPAQFNRVAGKLVDLYVLYRLALAVGLGRFADTLVGVAINKSFGQQEEEKHADILRTRNS